MKLQLLLLTALCGATCFAQKGHGPMPKQTAFVELMGSGLTYSVNYERFLYREQRFALGLRAGGGVTPLLLTWAPYSGLVGVTGLWAMDKGEYFEVGAYRVVLFDMEKGSAVPLTSAMIGYRYQPKPKGVAVRFGFTPYFARTANTENKAIPMIPYAGFSLGYAF